MNGYTFKIGDQGKTRGGAPYHVLAISMRLDSPLIIECQHDDRSWHHETRKLDGRLTSDASAPEDLIPPPRIVTLKECWIIYTPEGNITSFLSTSPWPLARLPGYFSRHIPAEDREIE